MEVKMPKEKKDRDRQKVFRFLGDSDAAQAIESQPDTSSLILPPAPLSREHGGHFETTAGFWQALLTERIRARRTVTLHDVLLSEWFPRSPGLYHTREAYAAREEAQSFGIELTEEEES